MLDYHIHTKLCSHARGEAEEYAARAASLGLQEIGFADHFPVNFQPLFSHPVRSITMSEEEIPLYLETLDRAARTQPGLTVKKGFEVDFLPEENLFFKKYAGLLPELDYVIGSVHFIDGWGFDQAEFRDRIRTEGIRGLWEKYLKRQKQMVAECGALIDCVGHLDLPKKLGWPFPPELREEMEDLLASIREKELVIEANTSGFDRPAAELYPSPDILRLAFQKGIEITLGSDAHAPGEVGRHFKKAGETLKNAGISRLVRFTRHKKDFVSF